MDKSELHPDLVEFIPSLSRLQNILAQYENKFFWLAKISRVKQIAENSDGYCVEMFLGLFGGIGSLNDGVLDARDPASDTFRKELDLAYQIAQSLRQ